MKGRTICFFLGTFWLLLICTILSSSIERQMTVKVQVLEPTPSMLEMNAPMQVYSSEILSGGNLYESVEGSEWESGFRAEIVPPELYITEGNEIMLSPEGAGLSEKILYRTKELFPGAVVQKIMPIQGKEGLYLTLSPKKEPQLSSMTGKEPYMENLQKEELGLLPEERLYSMTELENFSNMFLFLGLLLASLASTLFIWIYSWKLSKNVRKHKTPLLVNGGVLTLLLLGIYKLAAALQLASTLFIWIYSWKLSKNVRKHKTPLLVNGGVLTLLLLGIYKLAAALQLSSSLLPKENILDLEHYRETFGFVLKALEKLQQMGNEEAEKILEMFQHNLHLGCLAAILGICPESFGEIATNGK